VKLIRVLRKELASEALGWVKEGFISREQATRILEQYETSLPGDDQSAHGYRILMTLAALFIGLAVIVLVSANWEEMPRAGRMLGLIAVTSAANAMGIRAYMQERESTGKIWLFLGALLYGASIMLIAQIYHLGEHFPDGIFWWIMGILPLALLTKNRILMLMSITLSFIWFFVEAQMLFMPWAFVLFMGAAIWFSVQLRRSVLSFFAAIFGLNLWVVVLSSWFLGRGEGRLVSGFDTFVFASACTIFTVVAGAWMQRSAATDRLRDYGSVIRIWGVRSGLIALLIYSYEEPWKSLFESKFEHRAMLYLSLLIGFGSWLFAGACQLRANQTRQTAFRLAVTGMAVCFWTAGLMTAAFVEGSNPVHWQIASNLVAVLCGVALIIEAVKETSSAYFYLGVGMLLLIALFRYFDLIGEYVGAAVLFMVCAGILMAAARYWRRFSGSKQGNAA
jgi:uncharacterized membrane protein